MLSKSGKPQSGKPHSGKPNKVTFKKMVTSPTNSQHEINKRVLRIMSGGKII